MKQQTFAIILICLTVLIPIETKASSLFKATQTINVCDGHDPLEKGWVNSPEGLLKAQMRVYCRGVIDGLKTAKGFCPPQEGSIESMQNKAMAHVHDFILENREKRLIKDFSYPRVAYMSLRRIYPCEK